jgi:hypothetical protein
MIRRSVIRGSTPKTSEFLELFIFNDLWHVFGGMEADRRPVAAKYAGPGAAYVVRGGRFSRQLSLVLPVGRTDPIAVGAPEERRKRLRFCHSLRMGAGLLTGCASRLDAWL